MSGEAAAEVRVVVAVGAAVVAAVMATLAARKVEDSGSAVTVTVAVAGAVMVEGALEAVGFLAKEAGTRGARSPQSGAT